MKDRYVALYITELVKVRDKLNDSDKAQIINALADLLEKGECKPTLSPVGEILWEYIEKRITDNWDHYEDVCNTHRENGKLGGRPKKQMVIEENQNNQKVIEETKNNQKNLSIKYKVESIKLKEESIKNNIIEEDKSSLSSELDFDALKSYWNNQIVKTNSTMRQINNMSDKRKSAIRARLRENKGDKKIIQQAIDNAISSDFLNGKNDKNWVADFDWVFKPNNFNKVIDGNYTNKATASSSSSNPFANYDFSKYFVNDGK